MAAVGWQPARAALLFVQLVVLRYEDEDVDSLGSFSPLCSFG